MDFLYKDLIIKIGLYLDFKSIYSYSICNKKIYNTVWNNQIFWNSKIKELNYPFLNKKFYKLYCYILDKDYDKGLKISCEKGLKDLIQYYIIKYPNLDYKSCYLWTKKKNILKVLQKNGIYNDHHYFYLN